jgi:hypothetical protein
MEEMMEDPLEDNITAQIEAQLEAQLQGEITGEPQIRSYTRRYIDRDHEGDHNRLFALYFSENPLYTDYQFRRRYRMRKNLFMHIVQALGHWSPYFRLRRDAFGKVGLSPIMKCTAALRMLAYGTPADLMDEAFGIPESTAIDCMLNFVKGIRHIFGQHYLRKPNSDDIQRLLQEGEARGFPGMLGSVDCMHWQWEMCPVGWRGQFQRGDQKGPTIMLEAVASADLWIWHAFFGVAGSNNDINVLNQSTLFTQLLQGRAPAVQFHANGREYNMGYYLADGIYPEWATFVKTIPLPQSDEAKLFAQKQEGCRKDVERSFGVLQKRWAIVRRPVRLWHRDDLADIMYGCIIMHNMIIEDEREANEINQDHTYDQGTSEAIPGLAHGPIHDFATVLEINTRIHDRPVHRQLQEDLVAHIWQLFQDDQD